MAPPAAKPAKAATTGPADSITVATTPAATAITDPTDRSTPPVARTSVIPAPTRIAEDA